MDRIGVNMEFTPQEFPHLWDFIKRCDMECELKKAQKWRRQVER